MTMFNELIAQYRAWKIKTDREIERTRQITLIVRIPYTPGNEVALRGMTVRDLSVTLPVPLERVEVKCLVNPDWRK
jgi:hypothetical protein